MSEYSIDEQLEAATSVYPLEAAKILRANLPDELNGVPSRSWFAQRFTFQYEDLLEFLKDSPDIRQRAINRSLETRAGRSAYVVPLEDDTYEVGHFDGAREDVVRHTDEAAAVTDYVLAFWGLPRRNYTPKRSRAP
jgi:hypothetical protein